MQCKSLDVCRGKMSLCAFTIMWVQCMLPVDFSSITVHLCVCLREGQSKYSRGCMCLPWRDGYSHFESHCERHEKMRDTVKLEKCPSEQTFKTTATECPPTHLYGTNLFSLQQMRYQTLADEAFSIFSYC